MCAYVHLRIWTIFYLCALSGIQSHLSEMDEDWKLWKGSSMNLCITTIDIILSSQIVCPKGPMMPVYYVDMRV